MCAHVHARILQTCTAPMVEMTFIARDVSFFFFFLKLIKNDGNSLSCSPFSDEAHKASKRKTRVNLEISPKIGPCLWVLLEDRKLPAVASKQAGGSRVGEAWPDGDDRSVVGIHVPLTCYCELPAAPADNCHLSHGRHSQRDKLSLCLHCCCLLLAPRSHASGPALNPGN